MRASPLALTVAVITVILPLASTAFARKAPLTPEQLLAESKLIVVGRVQSHRDEPEIRADGSKTLHVFLTVQVESVAKGDDTAKPGDTVEARCWVVIAGPRDGSDVWDSGHLNIPGDGGRANFFFDDRSGDAWTVIYPNGIERLDETPVLMFPPEAPAPEAKPAPAAAPGPAAAQPPARRKLLVVGVSVAALLFAGVIWWWIAGRRRTV